MKYPALMNVDGDLKAIAPGHGLRKAAVAEINRIVLGTPQEGWIVDVEELFLDFHPRLKWCERVAGWSCDSEGEWHGHWVEVQPNSYPETWFTVVTHTDADDE